MAKNTCRKNPFQSLCALASGVTLRRLSFSLNTLAPRCSRNCIFRLHSSYLSKTMSTRSTWMQCTNTAYGKFCQILNKAELHSKSFYNYRWWNCSKYSTVYIFLTTFMLRLQLNIWHTSTSRFLAYGMIFMFTYWANVAPTSGLMRWTKAAPSMMQAEAVGGIEATPGTGPSRQGVKSDFLPVLIRPAKAILGGSELFSCVKNSPGLIPWGRVWQIDLDCVWVVWSHAMSCSVLCGVGSRRAKILVYQGC